jgi:hypothetical protein
VNERVTFTWVGLDKAVVKLTKSLPESALYMMKLKVSESIHRIHSEAIKGIQKRSMGERVIRYKPGRHLHIVSKPGDPFNVDTGGTWTAIQPISAANGMSASIVGPQTAFWLERGTKDMKPRPWLRPALLKVSKLKSQIGLKIK